MNQTRKYVKTLSNNTTPAAQGFISISGTKYPGTTKPDNTQPKRKLKKHTIDMPTHTTGITELDKLPSGKIAKGNKSTLLND
jgi:hypothetical protein